jgi:hypothetical protein
MSQKHLLRQRKYEHKNFQLAHFTVEGEGIFFYFSGSFGKASIGNAPKP